MFKFSIMALLACILGLSFSIPETAAATQGKEKKSYSKSKMAKTKKAQKLKKSKKNKETKKNKKTLKKGKKYRKSGGPDLRALTTQSPLSEFTETPDNGVNSIETKSDL
ncbi:MAG: hypothetical protein HOP07_16420 [Bacteriovoracaceae bacterium]|nr:hypothetical protein [Bacteriovoracaceae bacterium]